MIQDHSLHNMKVSGESASANVKTAEAFLETLDKLIMEENYLIEQIFNMTKPPFSGNRCLKGFSSLMRSCQCQVSRSLRTE